MDITSVYPNATDLPDLTEPQFDGLRLVDQVDPTTVLVLAYGDSGDSWHGATVKRADLLKALRVHEAVLLDTDTGEFVFRDSLTPEQFHARGDNPTGTSRYQPLIFRQEVTS